MVGVGGGREDVEAVSRGAPCGEIVGVGFARITPPMGRREKLRGFGVGVGGGVGDAAVGCETPPRGTPCAAMVDWDFVVVVTPVTRCGEMLRRIVGVGVAGATADGEGVTRRSAGARAGTDASTQAL